MLGPSPIAAGAGFGKHVSLRTGTCLQVPPHRGLKREV